jgi:hypothetical protein
MNTITTAAAWAIATVLNQAGMEVNVETLGGRPVWTGATGSQVVAAAYAVIKQGGHLAETLEEIDWLTVSFEEQSISRDSWMSQELTLAPAATR